MGLYTYRHFIVLIQTFFGYALLHATRKSFSNVKKTISDQWTPSFHNATINATLPDYLWNDHCMFADVDAAEYFLGALDTAWLMAYALGLFISGAIGDRFDLRKLLSFGMCASSVTVLMFGTVSEWLSVYSKPYYAIFWVLTGILQSVGWPASVAIMGNWFGREGRGLIFGLWGTCSSVGNILGALMASGMLKYGYEYSFLLPAVVQLAGGIIIFFTLVPTPKELGLPEADEDRVRILQNQNTQTNTGSATEVAEQLPEPAQNGIVASDVQVVPRENRKKAVGFLEALRLPGVMLYSAAYGCLMWVNYAFLFWLPYYLTSQFGWGQVEADQNSIFYDVGGILGAILIGFITDKLPMRSPMMVLSLLVAIPALFIYSHSPNSHVINAILVAVIGFFIDGPVNLIGSAISADLGRQDKALSSEALATVTGIVDGTGNFGAAFGQILIPIIQQNLGWQSVFYLLMIMDALTIVCILPVVVREVGHWRHLRQNNPGASLSLLVEQDGPPSLNAQEGNGI